MITFIVAIILLVVGYFTYGKYIDKMFGPKEDRPTPAYDQRDNVDYVPMKTSSNSLIQLLNIAGVGPIFGPIMGALYGPVAFIWIVVGCIFAGAVHDYLTGMISIRNKGAHLPELAGKFLGQVMKHFVNIFSILLLLLTGTVFVTSPALLLHNLMDGRIALGIIIFAIFVYYILSTILPIDKIIGRIYPIFGALLLISAVGVGFRLIQTGAPIPELNLQNMHPDGAPIFPLLFFTITCGALSGFHATQTPIISRTTNKEKNGRFIFYGMMIAEGIIAMIWAAAGMSLFNGYDGLNEVLAKGEAALVVSKASHLLLGSVLGTIAVLGVIILPITSGDTSFRSARMIIADYLNYSQSSLLKRIIISAPLFIISFALTQVDFTILWRYFSWANQTTAVIALWVGAMYLLIAKKNFWVAAIPAVFMTWNIFVYILSQKIGLGLDLNMSYVIGFVLTAIWIAYFIYQYRKMTASVGQFELDHPIQTQQQIVS
ncbi:carbon starvation CstA family protein [Staphylococcus gallinarum]|jgi:carbon starvation protein CstA|uniref:carbon starvation CstA family protein n=1 Tax=Staphylococcus gallinarum TaxID=1293 RepID=UPI000D1CF9B6|nr:carbon starvation CstA family protein [Staphylococcus gallinarum]MBU7216710.1 carbon starvation protein A [Staphylococcus gallinarum]MCD8785638.1 carbon starvation protein A [Staphylococcus gallinarum]MCD8844099.1 carbon starvation protein A [Staphylococcus gallinarum]MCD8858349.1 carbon starvation protein A [Staphylococcus gallinarum]MCD8899644.1 carbon starvation protein A [Staphylococcus gallinarum]